MYGLIFVVSKHICMSEHVGMLKAFLLINFQVSKPILAVYNGFVFVTHECADCQLGWAVQIVLVWLGCSGCGGWVVVVWLRCAD